MVMFNSYVKLPGGNPKWRYFYHGVPIFMGTLGNVTVDCHWLKSGIPPLINLPAYKAAWARLSHHEKSESHLGSSLDGAEKPFELKN
jgi:hypothetical protein